MDEERDGFLVSRMLVDHRPLLIGGSIPGGINVGPMFFYISAIPYYLSRLNPIGAAYAAGMIGIIGVVGVFWAGKELFDSRVGLLAAVLAGFSILNIIYQRPWWPLTLSQVVTLVVYLALFKLWKGPTPPRRSRTLINWLWVLVLALIVGAQSDPSTLSLIPLSIIWLWWYRRRIGLTGKHYLAAAGLFVLAHATWFIFELRHDFQSTRAVSKLLSGVSWPYGQETPVWSGPTAVLKMTAATVYRLFIPTGFLDVTKQISPAEEFLNARMNGVWWPAGWGVLLVIGSYIIGSLVGQPKIKQESPGRTARRLLATHFLVSLVGILAYTMMFPGYVHEWMWYFMFPGFFMMAAYVSVVVFDKVRPWVPRVGPLLIVSWVLWQVSLFLKLDNVAGLGKKLAVVKVAQQEIAGRPYELRSEGEGSLRYGGWRYLFTLYGKPPVKSYMDYVYEDWLYPKSEAEPEVIVTVVNKVDGLKQSIDEWGDSRAFGEDQK